MDERGTASRRKESQVGALSHHRFPIIIFSLLVTTIVLAQVSTVHAPPTPSYALAQSSSRIQETNSPGVSLTLNVSNANPGSLYGFIWNVTDPAGGVTSFLDGGLSSAAGVLTLTSVYPRDFSGASVKYNGTYAIAVFQFRPGPGVLAAIGQFYAGLTDSISYSRTSEVTILAQGYASYENVTVRIWHAGSLVSGFPRYNQTSGSVFSYRWSVPASTPVGSYNVSLAGQATTKKPPDSQIFIVTATSISISQLVTNSTVPQGPGNTIFSFTATYPNGTQARTGAATIRLLEPDGVTTHKVLVSYNTTANSFEGAYKVSFSSPAGGWTVIVDPNSFDDGYGNIGPSAVVVRSFVVQAQIPQSQTVTYLLLIAVVFLGAALTIIVCWILFFGQKKIQRNVLKVDFQTIEREASRVENRDFFVKVHDQLKQREEAKPEEEKKDG